MRSAASRLHKGFSFAKRFRECSDQICCDGASWAGRWATWAPGGAVRGRAFSRVVLDLGCGKGEYTVACAKMRPDVLFVGFDVDAVCTLRAAEAAAAAGVDNAVFLMDGVPAFDDEAEAGAPAASAVADGIARGDVPGGSSAFAKHPEQAHASRASAGKGARSGAPAEIDLSAVFADGELSALLMNFPTPFPKKKKAHLRLTYLDRLMTYRPLLGQGAGIRLRTDSQPLRDFTLTQLELAGYKVTWRSDDVRAEFPSEPWSAYERKLTEQGACAFGIFACPGPAPERVEQTAPLSLVSYLPDNLDQLDYVPHGMQGCVENLRNRNARERARGKKEFRPPVI
ncbi:methyltransferase domain-containing protein [uncultured Senegalimassilia sp.]|uniref:tRNA (guanine(46)-N(7))-methyltransferase TrmB n=1 Tax=uncultured Senegalimassilia sp. TaxID=1714350 RepID=UPI0025F60547|nr:methyltransferase domain-containing protein [uncultured Senegalimassilia sp.]